MAKLLRYAVVGPRMEADASYSDHGPALSRTITEASRSARAGLEGTWYVEDGVTGSKLGYSESDKDGVITTTGRAR